ncbi:MAG: glycosyltransferase, partial [Verrucomicrobiia bacterium]
READLPEIDERIEVHVGNQPKIRALYAEGDVAIQPSKMEGIGFMVLEPVASGMPTITLDYPPMNEVVAEKELLAKRRWFKRKALPSAWVKHAHLRLPSIRDLASKIAMCAERDLGPYSQRNRAWAQSEFDRVWLAEKWEEAVARILP